MKKILFCFIFAGLSISLLHSQENSGMMSSVKRDILDSVMNLNYTHPEGYILDSTYFERIDDVYLSRIHAAISVFDETHLASRDGHFLTFLLIQEPSTRENSVDKEHIYEIKNLVKELYGEKNVDKWEKYVRFYSSQDAKREFNADTVISLSLPKEKNGYYVSPYPYGSVLVIQKNNRGYLPMFCFYDETGKKNLEKYMSDLKGAFRYGDEQPLKKNLDRTRDLVTVRAIPMQKKKNIIR
jgi:hypothetical protein